MAKKMLSTCELGNYVLKQIKICNSVRGLILKTGDSA